MASALNPLFIQYETSRSGQRRARDRGPAAVRIRFAWHAAPGGHDISADKVRDRPTLEGSAARVSGRLGAGKLLRPHGCAADIRSEALKAKIHRRCGRW